jgi:hypothetical protein
MATKFAEKSSSRKMSPSRDVSNGPFQYLVDSYAVQHADNLDRRNIDWLQLRRVDSHGVQTTWT